MIYIYQYISDHIYNYVDIILLILNEAIKTTAILKAILKLQLLWKTSRNISKGINRKYEVQDVCKQLTWVLSKMLQNSIN